MRETSNDSGYGYTLDEKVNYIEIFGFDATKVFEPSTNEIF